MDKWPLALGKRCELIMWNYEKKLQYPVNIKTPNPKLAKVIITQLGGPDGELAASLRYLNQRYSMPYSELKGLLTDIGTEASVMLLHQNSMTYKPFYGILIHKIRSNEVLARYSKKICLIRIQHQRKRQIAKKKIIRIFV